MLRFADLDNSASRTKHSRVRVGTWWLIPCIFFAATIVSLAVGMALPALIGSSHPRAGRTGVNTAPLARNGEYDYLQGMRKQRREEHGRRSIPSQDVMAYCAVPGTTDPM